MASANTQPRHHLRLNPDAARYAKTYDYYRALFHDQLENLTHRDILMERIFRPGVSGRPLPDRFAFVFWKARFILHPQARRRARELMPELYRCYLRKPFEDPTDGRHEIDRRIIVALIHFAIWTGRSQWVFSLAEHLRAHGCEWDAVYRTAALLSACEHPERPLAADFYARSVGHDDPYFDYCYEILRGRKRPGAHDDPEAVPGGGAAAGHDGGPSVKRLLWLEAAYTGDTETEAYVIRRMAKNPPVDEDDLLDLYANLQMRGKLFRANRLLLRHAKFMGEKAYLSRLVLNAYLINGKYVHYLRRLQEFSVWPGRSAYFETVYCIHRLGAHEREERLLQKAMADKQDLLLPPEELRYRFRTALEVARNGHPPVLGPDHEERGDLVENHYFLEAAAKISGGGHDPRLMQERFRIFKEIVSNLRGDGPRDYERAAFYFKTLLRTFEQYADRLSGAVRPQFEAMAGRCLAARAFFGLQLFDQHEFDAAGRFLRNAGGAHPALLHARSELMIREERFDRAEAIYGRLLRLFPDSPTLLFNLGLIYERASRFDEALRQYHRVLEVDPTFKDAREKIGLLG